MPARERSKRLAIDCPNCPQVSRFPAILPRTARRLSPAVGTGSREKGSDRPGSRPRRADLRAPGQHLHARRHGLRQRFAVGGSISPAALTAQYPGETHRITSAPGWIRGQHRLQVLQVLAATAADRIGKHALPTLPAQGHGFDLHEDPPASPCSSRSARLLSA